MSASSQEKELSLSPDQKFDEFCAEWAKEHGKSFVVENYDGHQPPDLIDGMEVDDVWGWLIAPGEKQDDEHYGCLQWRIVENKLHLEWKTY